MAFTSQKKDYVSLKEEEYDVIDEMVKRGYTASTLLKLGLIGAIITGIYVWVAPDHGKYLYQETIQIGRELSEISVSKLEEIIK